MGKVDSIHGTMVTGELSSPEVDDVLDDLAEIVTSMDGEVMVLQGDERPGQTGVAATGRF